MIFKLREGGKEDLKEGKGGMAKSFTIEQKEKGAGRKGGLTQQEGK